jgi:hypothetical protein
MAVSQNIQLDSRSFSNQRLRAAWPDQATTVLCCQHLTPEVINRRVQMLALPRDLGLVHVILLEQVKCGSEFFIDSFIGAGFLRQSRELPCMVRPAPPAAEWRTR